MAEERVGVFFANGIGDAILTLPAVRHLIEYCDVRFIAAPASNTFQTVFREFGHLVEPFEKRPHELTAEFLLHYANQVDILILMITWTTPEIEKLINKKGSETKIINFVDYIDFDKNYFHNYFNLARFVSKVNAPIVGRTGFPCQIDPTIDDKILAFDKCPYVVHTETFPEKQFSAALWVGCLNYLAERLPTRIIAIVDKFEPFWLNETLPNVLWAGGDFDLSCLYVNRCAGFIGIDSCFLHLADLCLRPSIGLFRSTDVRRWGLALTSRKANVELSSSEDRDFLFEQLREVFAI